MDHMTKNIELQQRDPQGGLKSLTRAIGSAERLKEYLFYLILTKNHKEPFAAPTRIVNIIFLHF